MLNLEKAVAYLKTELESVNQIIEALEAMPTQKISIRPKRAAKSAGLIAGLREADEDQRPQVVVEDFRAMSG